MKFNPFVPIALGFIGGMLLAGFLPVPLSWLLAAGGALAVLGLLARRRPPLATCLNLMATVVLGISAAALGEQAIDDPAVAAMPAFSRLDGIGAVRDEPVESNGRLRFILRLSAVRTGAGWRAARGAVLVYAKKSGARPQRFERIFFRGNILPPLARRNPGAFNFRRYLRGLGAQTTVRVRSDGWLYMTGVRNRPVLPTAEWVQAARGTLRHGIERLTLNPAIRDTTANGLLQALLIGDRRELDTGVSEEFARSGVIHVLAVSGLHVGFVVLIGFAVARLFGIPERKWLIPMLLLIWLFAGITGFRPPVVRASLMASLLLLGRMLDRRSSAANLLALAAFLLLLFRPGDLFQPGFQLSFAAVAGILVFYPLFSGAMKKWRPVRDLYRVKSVRSLLELMAVSLAAQLATLPLTVYHFGRFSVIGVLANLVVVPGIFLLVAGAAASLLLLPISALAGQAGGMVLHYIVRTIVKFTAFAASFEFASIEDWHPPIWILLLYINILLIFISRRSLQTRRALVIFLLCLLNYGIWFSPLTGFRQVRATFLDVGQGNAALVQLPRKHAILIDAGPASPNYDVGARVILPVLKWYGIQTLDLVIITHPHTDHMAGLPAILRSMPVHKLVFADTTYPDRAFKEVMRMAKRVGVPINIAKRGDVITDFLPVQIWIAGPSPAAARAKVHLNEASLVVQVRYGRTAFLFTGDTGHRGEQELQSFGALLASDVLQVGHHGSRTSSSHTLISCVQPQWAVFSVGAFNRFLHPHREILERFAAEGSDTLRTDLHGAFEFRSDGHKIVRVY